jgi:Arm DNA-binding domain
MGKLTKRAIDALTPPEKGEIFVWDTELRGFGLRVKSTGGKTYLVQYRNTEGRTRRLAIGQHGGVTTGGTGVAARAVGTLRSIFGHASRVGLIECNPVTGVRLVASEQQSRRLSRA